MSATIGSGAPLSLSSGIGAAPRDRSATLVVWAVWSALLTVALGCIVLYGRNIPLAEDWTTVPALTGNERSFANWLWSQNNEHRVPLPRLLHLALLKASGGDFRAGMILNTLVVAALTAAMVLTARRLRGRTSFADVFFPLALMHVGHWLNLFWSWQIQFVSSVALMVVLLLAAARQEGALRGSRALAVAVALVLLPLTGASGLIVVAIMAPWVFLSASTQLRRGPDRSVGTGVLLLGALLVAGVTGLLYFLGYERPTWNAPSPGHGATLRTAAMFLALGFGPAAALAWQVTVPAAGALLVPAAWLLLRAIWRERGPERLRAVGLASFGAALVVLALGIGYGRAAQVPAIGLPDRYALFAAPAFALAYYAWLLYGSVRWRRLAPAALALVFAVLLPLNVLRGIGTRDWYTNGADAVERDIAAGSTAAALAERHRTFLMHWDERGLGERIEMLRKAGRGPFARVRPEPTP